MHPGVVRDALTLLAGGASGVLSGVFGVGGTVISTPAIRVLGASALFSVGTTLPSVLPAAISGAVRYQRERLIDWRHVVVIAPVGIVMSIVGALLTDVVPGNGHLLMLATAALVAMSAWRIGRVNSQPSAARSADSDTPGVGTSAPVRLATLLLVGSAAGFLSGLLGIGGGIVLVPGLHQVARSSLKRAVATSLVCVGILAIPGTITHGLLHQIDWRFAILLAIGIVPGARFGAGMAIRADDRRLRVAFSVFLWVVAIGFTAGELIALLG